MTPDNSRGGPLVTDRPTAENPGEKFTGHGTPTRRRKPLPTPCIASAVHVVAGTGTPRFVATYRCPGCGCFHLAHLRGELPASATRKAACGRVTVLLLPALAVRLGGAAA